MELLVRNHRIAQLYPLLMALSFYPRLITSIRWYQTRSFKAKLPVVMCFLTYTPWEFLEWIQF